MSFIDVAAIVGGMALEGMAAVGVEGATAAAIEAAGGSTLASSIAGGIGAVAEGALTGSVLGAAGSALTGQDVGKGAMFGALGGGLTSGLGSAFGGAAKAAGVAAPESAALQAAKQTINTPIAPLGGGIAGVPGATAGAGAVPSAWGMGEGSLIGNGASALEGMPKIGSLPAAGALPNAAGGFANAFGQANPLAMDKILESGMQAVPKSTELLPEAIKPALTPKEIINANLDKTLYGQHNIMIPGMGAMLGGMFAGGDGTPSNSNIPGAQNWNPWGNWYNFNPKTFHGQPSGYTGYLYPGQNRGYAGGGIAEIDLGSSDPAKGATDNVDFMGGDMYPTSQQNLSFYASPTQMPTSAQQSMASYEPKTNPLTGETTAHMAEGGIAQLAVGGKLLKGPGDGMSDDLPANIDGKQQARLADGEFVVPADVVSHLGNGSTDAGAKQLYAMMDKVRKARTGRKAQGKEINPGKYMPA